MSCNNVFNILWNLYSSEAKHIASGESWKYSTGQKTVFTRSAITPPKINRFDLDEIWSTASTWWRLALADFGLDPLGNDSLRGSQKFCCFWSGK